MRAAVEGECYSYLTMHRYPTRFATMNRSYFPTKDDAEYNHADDTHDASEDYDAYVASTRRCTFNCSQSEDDEEYFPETTADEDNYDEYVAATGLALKSYAKDEEYVVNLKDWHVSMGRRPVTRSMSRGLGSKA